MNSEVFIALVCGGRKYGVAIYPLHCDDEHRLAISRWALQQQRVLDEALSRLHRQHHFTHVVQGGADGADRLAGEWATRNGVQEVLCPANWAIHGLSAGARRNVAMSLLPIDLVVAFPGGRGTASMMDIALAKGIRVQTEG